MKTALITWDLPTTRQSGLPLAITDIKHVEVLLSADLGATYGLLDAVAPPVTQLSVPDLEVGEWRFRLVVVDTADRRSSNIDVTAIVPDESAPGTVTNVNITLS